jgi:hypothetical protein
MMLESGIPQNHETRHRVDLIYKAVNPNKSVMNFDSFLQAIYKLAEFLYPPKDKESSLKQLVATHLIPLADAIEGPV